MAAKETERPPVLAKDATNKSPLARVIILFSLIITLVNIFVVVQRGSESYQASLDSGKTYTERLTRSISDHVELTFFGADSIVQRGIERQYFNSLFGNNLVKDMQNNISNWVQETPQITAMLMTDEKGNIVAIDRKSGFKTWMEGRNNVASQPFFKSHVDADDEEMLYVGWVPSWIRSNSGLVVMSRRMHKLDGSFGGVMLAAIDGNYVLDFLKSVEQERATKIVLLRDDMLPLISQVEAQQEVSLLRDVITQEVVDPNEVATIISEENYDDTLRLIGLDALPSISMMLAVVVYEDDVFSGWRAQRINDLVFLGIFLLFVIVVSLFALAITAQMQRSRRSEKAAIMASQAKSEFLANMSHELRTPLNAIIGFSEMIEAGYFGKTNAKQRERLKDIHFCGNHLLELINDILEFSKGDAGRLELREEKISLHRIITDTSRIFTDKAKAEGRRIICNIQELPPVLADARKIRQVMLNLLSNAMKFTDKNGTIEVSCQLDTDKNVVFTVSDNGIGMKEEDIPKALSIFGQVHNDPARGGTGLGLPLCKMFAELHGGSLELKSIEGVGTKVSVTLPAERVIWSNDNRLRSVGGSNGASKSA